MRFLAIACVVCAAFGAAMGQAPASGDPVRNWQVRYYTHPIEPPLYEQSPDEIFASNKRLADAGNKEAAYQIALAYLQGYGVDQDLELAEKWFELGADRIFEKRQVAGMYLDGFYFAKSLARVERWYLAAGDPGSLFDLARIYQMGRLSEPQVTKAIGIYIGLLKLTGDPYVRRAEFELGNLSIDGLYTSGDPRIDLRYARKITQELIGQEQYKLAYAHGSDMDLPGTPEVTAQVVRSAAAYDVDLAEAQMAQGVVPVSAARAYVWMELAGRYREASRMESEAMRQRLSTEEVAQAADDLAALERIRIESGAYYLPDDPLRNPDFSEMKKRLAHYSDPDEQLRLAYAYELKAKDPASSRKAMDLYRTVRDERVAGVRMKIGTEYLFGRNGYPKSAEIAAKWYGFAAKAGSVEACQHLAALYKAGLLPPDAGTMTTCSRFGG